MPGQDGVVAKENPSYSQIEGGTRKLTVRVDHVEARKEMFEADEADHCATCSV